MGIGLKFQLFTFPKALWYYKKHINILTGKKKHSRPRPIRAYRNASNLFISQYGPILVRKEFQGLVKFILVGQFTLGDGILPFRNVNSYCE